MLRSGAPFGPTMAFLFASPLLDPVVLGLLVFLVGVEGMVTYAALTFSASILIGALFARLGLEKDVKPLPEAEGRGEAPPGCEAVGSAKGPVGRRAWAAIYGLMPTNWVVAVAGPGQPLAIPLAAVLGVPMYVNAETFFPISAALLQKGVGVGAVMALVVTSMGVSVPEVVLLVCLFRWRLVAALVASVFAVAVGGGTLFAPTLG